MANGLLKKVRPKQQFDFGSAIKEDGFEFVRQDNQGRTFVRDVQSGQEGVYDVEGLLNELGTNSNETKVIFNTTDNPIPISPLSFTERAKVKGFGNERGAIKFLREKFDKVLPSEDNGLLVQKNGVWHQVDPTLLSQLRGGANPWEITKELVKDVADLGDIGLNALLVAKGATKGAAVGAVAGSVVPGIGTGAGAIVGGLLGAGLGGVAAGSIRTSLGRLVGTYDATPEEEIKDIGLEGIYSLGGQGIAAATRPLLRALGRAAGSINRTVIKEGTIAAYGNITGVGRGAMRELIENNTGVTRAMKGAIEKAGGKNATAEAAINQAADDAISNADQLFKAAEEALPRKYGKLLDEVFTGAEKAKMNVNMTNVIDKSLKNIQDIGIGKIEKQEGKSILKAFTETEKIARIQSELPAPEVEPSAIRQINSLIREMDLFGKAGIVKGGTAANRLQALNKRLNALSRKTFEGQQASQEFKAAVAKTTEGFRNNLKSEFRKVGLEDKYVEMQSLYNKFANSVSVARKMRQQTGGAERFVTRIMSDSTANRTQIGIAKDMIELTGAQGRKLFESMAENTTASKFLNWAPKMGLVQAGVLGGGAGAAAFGGVKFGLGTLISLGQFSPRIVAGQVGIMKNLGQSLSFIKTRTPAQLRQLVSDPAAFDALIRLPLVEGAQESELVDRLLQQSGAIGEQ